MEVRQVQKHKEGKLNLQGVLYSVYANYPFVLHNYMDTHLTSKKIDNRNYMIHFPTGATLTPQMDVALYCLDQVANAQFDVHYGPLQ